MTPEALLKKELEETACELTHAELVASLEKHVESRVLACKQGIAKELHELNQTLCKAFPETKDGSPDISGHRNYHDAQTRAAEAQEKFWQEMRLDLAKKGMWGLLVIVVGLVVVGAQVKLGVIKIL